MPDPRASDSDDDLTPLVGKARYDAVVAGRDRYCEALVLARDALHRCCLERGSTEGYRAAFTAINAALRA